MNGADALIATAVGHEIEVCFANPGTTEMPLVLAMDRLSTAGQGQLRPVLCLHENVATGAADGYARISGKPAMCLLHLGPGLANGLTNLHNARRAGSPIVNVVGQHATWHIAADPLLASDVASLAAWAGGRVNESSDASRVGADLAAAISAARSKGGIATLIVPHDVQLADARPTTTALTFEARSFDDSRVDEAQVDAGREALARGPAAILLGGAALTEAGLRLAGRIAAATGADLIADTFFPRMERGAGLPRVTRLPYFPDQALALTARYRHVVIAGTRQPVAFFGYPGLPSRLTTDAQTVMLADGHGDAIAALDALATAVNATDHFKPVPASRPDMPSGALTPATVSAVIARLQPENCIVMDEALTVGVLYFEASVAAPRFTHLTLTGGAIGQGPGAGTGAAIAAPGRKVINFQSDGCGAYSVQAFWTQAREGLDVVTIIGSNRSYNILKVELQRAGVAVGPASAAMTGLDRPYLDWVRIGEGFGVPGVRVEDAASLAKALENALATRGPSLIEAIMTD